MTEETTWKDSPVHARANFSRRYRLKVTSLAAALVASACALAPVADATELSSSQLVDAYGRPTQAVVEQVHQLADQPFVPPQVSEVLRTAVDFFAGNGEIGGPGLPQSAPPLTQFIWPTVSLNCMGPGLHSTASVIAVPGPAKIPAPGAASGQASFVFTALGTPPAAADQGLMSVYWINVDSLRTGVTPLENNGINPDGPSTLSGTADTGSGTVIAVAAGSVRTTDAVCAFAPTAAGFRVN